VALFSLTCHDRSPAGAVLLRVTNALPELDAAPLPNG
jgi:hypothetical protein